MGVSSVERARRSRGLVPLLLVCLAVLAVTIGLAQGLWMSNLHNAILGLTFTSVGAYVLLQRPGHLEGRLFLASGILPAAMFLGRQLGHADPDATWWAWVGVWPIAVSIGTATLAVLCFPDGRLPGPGWRPVAALVAGLSVVLAAMSALWPVEYAETGISATHPSTSSTPELVDAVWSTVAHPVYIAMQLLWPVAVWARWRSADGVVKRQLSWVLLAAAAAAAALGLGLLLAGTPRAGLFLATLLPAVAGLAIVHGQHAAAYTALTWLSRRGASEADLPTDLARAASEALGGRAVLWLGDRDLHAVGVWPPSPEDIPATTYEPGPWIRGCRPAGDRVGALTLDRGTPLNRGEERLFDDLASQAGLVLQHLTVAEVLGRERRAAHVAGLTPREREVLELMADGLSNAAICERLHLSVKTVEPLVGSVFSKLQLLQDPDTNRRVLAVLAYRRMQEESERRPAE